MIKKYFWLYLLLLLSLVVAGCVSEKKIAESLDLNEDYEVFFESLIPESKQSITFVKNVQEDRSIIAEKFCVKNADCSSWGFPGSCNNAHFEQYSDFLQIQKQRFEQAGLTQDKQCACFENQCFYTGEPFSWIRNNLEKNSVILSWWDYGKKLEANALKPIVKHPSKAILNTIAACNFNGSTVCKELQKELETDEKIRDVSTFFTSSDLTESLCIAQKYNTNYIYIESKMIDMYPVISHTSNILNNVSNEWEQLETPQTIEEAESLFSKLFFFQGETINFLELAYSFTDPIEGGKYLIFKINYPNNISEIC